MYLVRASIPFNGYTVHNNGTDYKTPTKVINMYAEAEATDETASPNKEYNAELTKYASKENVIILTFIDSSFLELL